MPHLLWPEISSFECRYFYLVYNVVSVYMPTGLQVDKE